MAHQHDYISAARFGAQLSIEEWLEAFAEERGTQCAHEDAVNLCAVAKWLRAAKEQGFRLLPIDPISGEFIEDDDDPRNPPPWVREYRDSDRVRVPVALLEDCWGALRLLQLHLWRKHGVGRRTPMLLDIDHLHARLQYFGAVTVSEHVITWTYEAEQLPHTSQDTEVRSTDE